MKLKIIGGYESGIGFKPMFNNATSAGCRCHDGPLPFFLIGALLAVAMTGLAAGGEKMKITSRAFQEGENIPAKFTCDGQNVSPALHFEGAPAKATSLVLIVDDPDAPNGLFTHWLVWNMDAKTTEIAEGNGAGKGNQGKNDFGKLGYGGACPPSGTHRYYFKIFALDTELHLPAGSKRSQLDAAMKGHLLAEGELMGRYSRKK
jgi:Raf kinase inhibitor-like YbhB/YbcL family protein